MKIIFWRDPHLSSASHESLNIARIPPFADFTPPATDSDKTTHSYLAFI